jgi:carbon-monoxide dehydrogenase medium subunit
MLALDAEIVVRSPKGERTIRAGDFFKGAFTTAIAPTEILTEVRLPGPRDDAGSAYRKLTQRASGYAIVGVAAVVVRGADRKITEARVGITGVGDAAYRATAVEKALTGSDGSAKAIAAAAAHAAEGRTVNGDIHADTEYRTAMAVIYTRRAIEGALARLDE